MHICLVNCLDLSETNNDQLSELLNLKVCVFHLTQWIVCTIQFRVDWMDVTWCFLQGTDWSGLTWLLSIMQLCAFLPCCSVAHLCCDSMNMKAIFTPKLWVSSNFLAWEVFALSPGHPYYEGCSKVQWIMTFGLDLNLYLPNLCVHFYAINFFFFQYPIEVLSADRCIALLRCHMHLYSILKRAWHPERTIQWYLAIAFSIREA